MNMIIMLHDLFFYFLHPVTALKRGSRGRLVFAKCVLPSENKSVTIIFIFIIIIIIIIIIINWSLTVMQ